MRKDKKPQIENYLNEKIKSLSNMFASKKKGKVFSFVVVILLFIALAGVFVSGPELTGKVTKDTCFDGTEYGKCSFVKPKYCDRGALKPNCQKCGCSAEEVCLENGECILKCSDGTLFGRCSKEQPLYCVKGTLVENCKKCGCYEGGACQADGKCTGRMIRRCEDNTIYNRCSTEKPKYCENGNLIDKCSLCGCDEGKICKEEKCVEKEQEVIVENSNVESSNIVSEDISAPKVEEKKDLKWFLGWLCEVLKLRC